MLVAVIIKMTTKEEEINQMLWEYEKDLRNGYKVLCKEVRRILQDNKEQILQEKKE